MRRISLWAFTWLGDKETVRLDSMWCIRNISIELQVFNLISSHSLCTIFLKAYQRYLSISKHEAILYSLSTDKLRPRRSQGFGSGMQWVRPLDPQHDYNLYTYLKNKTVNVHMHIPRQNLKAFRNGLLHILEVSRQMMKSPTLLRGPVTKWLHLPSSSFCILLVILGTSTTFPRGSRPTCRYQVGQGQFRRI